MYREMEKKIDKKWHKEANLQFENGIEVKLEFLYKINFSNNVSSLMKKSWV